MAVVASMSSNWPRGSNDSKDLNHEHHLSPTLPGYQAELTRAFGTLSPSSANFRSSCQSNSSVETDKEVVLPSYLSFEPVVSSVSENEHIDWRRYDPPAELHHMQDDTSEEIRGLLQTSIERIKARHAEEEERRTAAARLKKPLARANRVSMKPRRPSAIDGLRPLDRTENSRLSVGSQISVSSTDSGYSSIPLDTKFSSKPSKSEKRLFSGLAAFVKPKKGNKSISPLERLGEMSSVLALSDTGAAFSKAGLFEADSTAITTGECVSCFDDFPMKGLVKLNCHNYCPPCFARLIDNALQSETQFPPKCCLNPIPYPLIPVKVQKLYRARQLEWSTPASSRVYCSHSPCNSLIPPIHITPSHQLAACPTCHKKTCTACLGAAHRGECPDDPALRQTENLAEMQGWKRCYACHAFVEHNRGCRHITCRCTAQFCYICTARWKTCSCTDADLATLQEQVTRRQNETEMGRRAAEEEDARSQRLREEEAENVRMVAEFIRADEEARRVEEERERAATEERRLRREEGIRVQKQVLLSSIATRYIGLRRELEGLHLYQRPLLASRHEYATTTLSQSLADNLENLTISHAGALDALSATFRRDLEALESVFEQEQNEHLHAAHQTELNYLSALRTRADSSTSMAQINASVKELRNKHAKDYQVWDQDRVHKIEDLRRVHARQTEFLVWKQRSEIKEVRGRGEIERVEGVKRGKAEREWMDAVSVERGEMLGEMERREVEAVEVDEGLEWIDWDAF
ncbi:hypothetical protein HYFRA_00006582 [Hymenoscyphus fraxineus]|uniref:RBR-type E3 ubiquitin transferase n=1 Tax=Hymenoscyphus fraxineus TaxID=746836 RepID=A0A9N9PSR3_9HELO|nr:hypothetical protein HYFRA_00006582 [Hymenoscyphus fraxineus]